jgi:hypothetical protein
LRHYTQALIPATVLWCKMNSNALDRYITGNWGEDQFKGEVEYDEFVDTCCSECVFRRSCTIYDETECLVIKGIIDKQNQEQYEMELAREAQEESEDWDDYPDPESEWENRRDCYE